MKILYLNGEESGKKVLLPKAGANIGRENDNDIQLMVGGVSRYHARVEIQEGKWLLKDLGSTNGTKHNGQQIQKPAELRRGDVFAIGDQLFRVEENSLQKEPEQPRAIPNPSDVTTANPAPDAAGQGKPATFVFRLPAETSAGPAPAQSPAPDVTPAPEKTGKTGTLKITEETRKEELEKDSEYPNISFQSLFNKDKKKPESGSGDSNTKKNSRGNLLFCILVVMVACCCVAIFWRMQETDKQTSSGKGHTAGRKMANPFFLYYEKYDVSRNNNVFKFKLLLENNRLSFSLDDLHSGRSYAPAIPDPIADEAIDSLKKEIAATNFFQTGQQEQLEDTADNNRSYARIITGFDDKFNDITVKDIILTSFTQVEDAIGDFLRREVGVDATIMESKETLLRKAKELFDLAEKQFNSYMNQHENLWRSIENYRVAMRQYEVFAEKPAEWSIAREKLAEAENIQNKIKKEGNQKVNLYYQTKEYRRALEECADLMTYFQPDSETYKNIRDFKIEIEKIIKD